MRISFGKMGDPESKDGMKINYGKEEGFKGNVVADIGRGVHSVSVAACFTGSELALCILFGCCGNGFLSGERRRRRSRDENICKAG